MEKTRLEMIEETYKVIDENFDATWDKASNDDERELLASSREAAREVFWSVVSADLDKNSPVVRRIVEDLDVANDNLKKSLANLADVSVAIKAMEEAVRLAAALAALAI